MPALEMLLETHQSLKLNDEFRLWLSSMPSKIFPARSGDLEEACCPLSLSPSLPASLPLYLSLSAHFSVAVSVAILPSISLPGEIAVSARS